MLWHREGWGKLRTSRRTYADGLEQRNLPARGFRPGTMLLGMGLVMGYGWYHLIKGIREAKYVSEPPTR